MRFPCRKILRRLSRPSKAPRCTASRPQSERSRRASAARRRKARAGTSGPIDGLARSESAIRLVASRFRADEGICQKEIRYRVELKTGS